MWGCGCGQDPRIYPYLPLEGFSSGHSFPDLMNVNDRCYQIDGERKPEVRMRQLELLGDEIGHLTNMEITHVTNDLVGHIDHTGN
jgi:hypothetical protein